MDLDQRKQFILSAIVSAYIETGEPVGSKTLLDRERLSVSPATVRNEMSELERLGYLKKTHTSSGRVPSTQGYRYYVQKLTPYHLSESEQLTLGDYADRCVNLDELLEESTLHLARFSGCTVFGISRQAQDATYQFEILPAGRRILAIMVIAPGGSVKNYFYKAESDVVPKDAATLTKIFNTVFGNCPINRVGKLRMMLFEHEVKTNCPQHSAMIILVQKILDDTQKCTLHIGGTENLLSHPEFSDIESARGFIEMLSTREQLLEALLEKNPVGGLEIRIGAENGLLNSPHASLITLSSDEKFPVMLGLIGPARMNYARTIAGCYFTLANLKNFIEREY